jgi:SOS-response transcriptional repressor LexA
VAAGQFGASQTLDDENWEQWVEVRGRKKLAAGMFVAQVVGKSMEPAIPDGSYCLFSSPVAGRRKGRIVLARLSDATDPETGQRFTVKRYDSEKVTSDEGWRHTRVVLSPTNPAFQAIVLDAADEDRVAVIAEFLGVIR